VQLYKNESLKTSDKKNIMNHNIGVLGKRVSSQMTTCIFQNEKEANYYSSNYGFEPAILKEHNGQKLFIVSKRTNRIKLLNGFRDIQHLIYDIQRLKMYKIYKKLKYELKLKPFAIHTDCVFLEKNCKKELLDAFPLVDKHKIESIGTWKIEEKQGFPTDVLTFDRNRNPFPLNWAWSYKTRMTMEPIKITNELDYTSPEYFEEFRNIIENYKKIYVSGTTAGTGKSTLVKSLKDTYKVLIVTPDNKLSYDNKKEGFESITLWHLVGVTPDGQHVSSFDTTEYNLIFFDEVKKYGTEQHHWINKYIASSPDKRYIKAGDENQNRPIEQGLNNVDDWKDYYNTICKKTCWVTVELKINKRFPEHQRAEVERLKHESMSCNNFLKFAKKNFKACKVGEHPDAKYVCYKNKTVREVNRIISQNKLHSDIEIDGYKFKIGQEVVAQRRFKIFHVNNHYLIKEINDKEIILADILDEKIKHGVEKKRFTKDFQPDFAYTGHSAQGLTFKDCPVVLCDLDFKFVNAEWFYVAWSRANNLNNIYYVPVEDEFVNIRGIADKLITGYKTQDIRAGRKFSEKKFVDADWVVEKLHKCHSCCPACGIEMIDCFSVDRIDNRLPHVKTNCRLMCLDCNKSHHEEYKYFEKV
jgi:hypothetical protein